MAEKMSRKKTYTFSKVSLQPWLSRLKKDDNKLIDPNVLFLKRFELNKIQHCTFQTYCYHGNAIRRILAAGQPSLDIFLQQTPATIIEKMQDALESDKSSYYRKLMDFISTYLSSCLEFVTDVEDNEKLKAILQEYKKHCFDLKIQHQKQKEKNEKNQKEYDSWVSFHRLQEVCESLITKAQASNSTIFFDKENENVSKNQIYLQQREQKKKRIEFQEAIMISLYVLIPPCRNDLMDLKYCLYDKEKDNYFFIEDDGTGLIILNHYKTFKTYGTCTINLPLRLTNLISDFIDKFSPGAPFLFYNRHCKPYKDSTFSSHITEIFLNQTDKHVNIQTLRKIYATQNSFESIENTRIIARKMGHSVRTHYTYKKNNNEIDDNVRRFSFQTATRQMYNPKFDGDDFFFFRTKILQMDPALEVQAMITNLKLIGVPDKICFEDFNENNDIQKQFLQKFKKDNPNCTIIQ